VCHNDALEEKMPLPLTHIPLINAATSSNHISLIKRQATIICVCFSRPHGIFAFYVDRASEKKATVHKDDDGGGKINDVT
jgi:hypothetical protein